MQAFRFHLSRIMLKDAFGSYTYSKGQVSLRMRTIWSCLLLSTYRIWVFQIMLTNTKGAVQSECLHRLIWAFAARIYPKQIEELTTELCTLTSNDKSPFEYAQNVPIKIILRMRKVSSGLLLYFYSFCSIK